MIAAVVLAAGGSSRLGRPKQLERWGPGTLLGHVLDQVRRFPVDETWVVLGAGAEAVMETVDLSDFGIVENPEWEEGLAASLRVGLDALTRLSKAEAAFIVLGDQPDIPAEVPDKLVEAWRRSRSLAVVPKYRYTWGNPVLVARELWPRLMSLSGDEGARRLLQAHPEWVEEVWIESLPPRDVDTQRDVEELRPRRS
ncbi:MAG TPA: nucleotidyltransferase family protein [Acidimicrobiia bacterium]|nr:nucleotidyltransferase family protein [Acidimicrobiia bacterium]